MQRSGVLCDRSTGVFLQGVLTPRLKALLVLLASFFVCSASGAAAPIDFQRQIRPALSDACFQCHGPDPETRMMGLRLDIREGAFEERPTGVPVVPGDPEKSLIYQRITHDDAVRRMPPGHSHKTLTEEQIGLIREWIEQGAKWEEHWSFTPPRRAESPAVKTERWIRNPIDGFVLAKLEAEGLKPAPEAGRRTLLRRVALDVTGLPPSPEQVEIFLKDDSPDAYEKLVDRLMASEAYGEHRARYWLDAARYADTHGLHHDNYREMWPYRDWVIHAFNRNQPFDEFTVEQIAGDLLPNATKEQVIATGFNRCNITTSEGGSIKEEVLVMYAKDRVDTTSTVWLGLTVGCATCHDHKFDPIAQRDFYSMAAFFRNTTQKAMDLNYYDTPPAMILPPPDDEDRWEALRREEPQAREELARVRASAGDGFAAWLESRDRKALEVRRFDSSETLSLDLAKRAKARMGPESVPLMLEGATSAKRTHLELRKKGFAKVAAYPAFSADEAFTISVMLRLNKGGKTRVIASQEDPRDQSRGWKLDLSEGLPSISLTVRDGRTIGRKATGDRRVEVGQWHHIVATYDGRRQRGGLLLYLDGKLLPAENVGRATPTLEGSIETDAPLFLGVSDREEGDKSGFLNGAVRDFRILSRAVTEPEAELLSRWHMLGSARKKKPNNLSDGQREALESYYLVRHNRAFQEAASILTDLQEERRAILRRSAVTHVMKEKDDSDPMAHILYRGMYDQQRDEVGPATPGVLPPMPDGFPRNRLGLAKWLVDDTNPLTARVTVNRFWQEVFGAGLVKTAEDFGSQGEAPSHPKLLDWLAVEFRESGWDVKHMLRLILTSATYRQSAAVTDVKLARDSKNRFLSRGPRFRMDGEMIRDYALVASGLLSKRIGGPSVKPYHPEGVWEAVAMKGSNTRFYEQDEGESLYRRSMYTFWKRAAPPPSMVTFNAPTREFCSVRRERTNTPLQALLTLNGTQFFESARHLAANAVRASDGIDGQLDFISRRLLVRVLSQKEREVAQRAYKDYLHYYDSHPDAAKKALSVGDSVPEAGLPTAESAALTMVANQLMNLDEVLNK